MTALVSVIPILLLIILMMGFKVSGYRSAIVTLAVTIVLALFAAPAMGILPEGVGCCGFAGDRGFTFPELNKYGLRKLRPQIEANHIEVGYSNSRTCEIGLETNAGIPYMSIVYLVNEVTTAKKN